jgi:hypothetical protein
MYNTRIAEGAQYVSVDVGVQLCTVVGVQRVLVWIYSTCVDVGVQYVYWCGCTVGMLECLRSTCVDVSE